MLEYEDALQKTIALGRELGAEKLERVSLEAAYGRILAEDVHAAWPVPARDYSAMDGYAVSCADFEATEGSLLLPLVGESRPGSTPLALVRGTTQRIFTGGTIPAGADAIVIQENVRVGAAGIEFSTSPRRGDHIRRAGEDLAQGALALAQGTRISAAIQSLLATLELRDVFVTTKPRVTLLCTGDELRDPIGRGAGAELSAEPHSTEPPAGLAESNSLAIRAMCERRGARVIAVKRVRDERNLLRDALAQALAESDVVVTIGGASVGDHDLVKPLLKELGAEILVPKVAIKPGKPVFVARRERAIVLGLPGNPSSALVTFALFGWPLLGAWLGDEVLSLPEFTTELALPVSEKSGRRAFLRGTWGPDGVRVLSNQASGAGTAMAQANVLVHLEPHQGELPAGARVKVISLFEL